MLAYERHTGVPWVGGRAVRLGSDNVVVVDRADSVPTVVRTMHITVPLAPGRPVCAVEAAEAVADSIKATLGREPSLPPFLLP